MSQAIVWVTTNTERKSILGVIGVKSLGDFLHSMGVKIAKLILGRDSLGSGQQRCFIEFLL